jgi:FdhD protein
MDSPRRPGSSVRVRVHEVRDASQVTREDRLATEEPLEVRLGWPGTTAYRVGVTMRTPGHDFELAVGLLAAAGVVTGADQLRTVAYCRDRSLRPAERLNVVTVELVAAPGVAPARRDLGPASGGSACGVCGTGSIEEVEALMAPAARSCDPHPVVAAKVLHGLPDRLRESQKVFDSTGGLHAAGLFDADGEPLVVREDIGRHNAVDKVVGARILAGESPALPILAVSGRIGFEIVQKAAVAGVGVLAAVGAPSSLAVDLATRAGLCTVGFLRQERFVVYSVPDRVGV